MAVASLADRVVAFDMRADRATASLVDRDNLVAASSVDRATASSSVDQAGRVVPYTLAGRAASS